MYCLTASIIDSAVNSSAESKLGMSPAALTNLGNANKELGSDVKEI